MSRKKNRKRGRIPAGALAGRTMVTTEEREMLGTSNASGPLPKPVPAFVPPEPWTYHLAEGVEIHVAQFAEDKFDARFEDRSTPWATRETEAEAVLGLIQEADRTFRILREKNKTEQDAA